LTILPLGGFRYSERPKARKRERLADIDADSMLLRCFGKNERASERTSEGEGESGGERKCQSQLQVKGDDR
jgi:hypothetical protein